MVNPVSTFMSVIPRNCEIVSKATALTELFNLRFIESQYPSDPQTEAIYQLVKSKDTDTASKMYAMNRYYSQFSSDFYIRDNCIWMDDKLVIPNSLHTAINNSLPYHHHEKSNMFAAAKKIWYPYIHRNVANMAKNCQECMLAGEDKKTYVF